MNSMEKSIYYHKVTIYVKIYCNTEITATILSTFRQLFRKKDTQYEEIFPEIREVSLSFFET